MVLVWMKAETKFAYLSCEQIMSNLNVCNGCQKWYVWQRFHKKRNHKKKRSIYNRYYTKNKNVYKICTNISEYVKSKKTTKV